MELELREAKYRAQMESLRIQLLRDAETKVAYSRSRILLSYGHSFYLLARATCRRATREARSNRGRTQ